MLHDFLVRNEREILNLTVQKTAALTGIGPSSQLLSESLPLFYRLMLEVLRSKSSSQSHTAFDQAAITAGANASDEPAMARASGHEENVTVAEAAGNHGRELLRLGYTLSHVVHAYGAICQSITELAGQEKITVTTDEFRDLNGCLDIAIAGAVTAFSTMHNEQEKSREVKALGFLAHELRNTLTSVNLSFQMIKAGTVGISGSTGRVLENGLKRIETLIDRSLTEVRLAVEPALHAEVFYLLQLVDAIVLTASVEARAREQHLSVDIDPHVRVSGDLQLLHSAVSNLIQNALKYTPIGGHIQVRGRLEQGQILVEVEDECGGLLAGEPADLFKPFVQRNENRSGLGLGLTIAQKAISLNGGKIAARNLPGKGCVFTVTLPNAGKTTSAP